jgi:hypothetical protein
MSRRFELLVFAEDFLAVGQYLRNWSTRTLRTYRRSYSAMPFNANLV